MEFPTEVILEAFHEPEHLEEASMIQLNLLLSYPIFASCSHSKIVAGVIEGGVFTHQDLRKLKCFSLSYVNAKCSLKWPAVSRESTDGSFLCVFLNSERT